MNKNDILENIIFLRWKYSYSAGEMSNDVVLIVATIPSKEYEKRTKKEKLSIGTVGSIIFEC